MSILPTPGRSSIAPASGRDRHPTSGAGGRPGQESAGALPVSGLNKHQVYGFGVAGGIVGRVVEIVGGLAQVWLLTRILGKLEFGQFAFAYAIVRLLALVSASGLQRLVIYRLSRSDAPAGVMAGGHFVGAALGWGFVISAAAGAVCAFGAGLVSGWADNPGLRTWLAGLAWLVPITGVTTIYSGWYQARHRLAEAVLLGSALPIVLVVAALVIAWWLAGGPVAVMVAMVAGSLLGLLLLVARYPVNPFRLWGPIGRRDARYAAETTALTVANRGVRYSDLIMLGALAGPVAAADYAVVLKLTALLLLGHGLLTPIFSPRIGTLLKRGRDELGAEFNENRVIGILFALGVVVPIAALGRPLLGLFGDYEAAYPLLLVLAMVPLVVVLFGPSGVVLTMAGRSGWVLITNAALLAGNIVLNAVLIPTYGVIGAAIATLVSIVALKAVTALLLRRMEGVVTFHAIQALIIAILLTTLAFGACAVIPPAVVAGGLATAFLIIAAYSRHTIRGVANVVVARFFGRRTA